MSEVPWGHALVQTQLSQAGVELPCREVFLQSLVPAGQMLPAIMKARFWFSF